MDEETLEYRRKMDRFRQTEIGKLFERFVNLHASAWQLDERSSWNGQDKTARKAWDDMEPVLKELQQRLMEIEGIK